MSGGNESAVELAHARVGMTLHDKWRLDALLGVGGMAAVYAATHRNGARAAIKMLHLAVSLDADVRRRFLREGYLANAVAHPGSVRVLDDDVAEDGSAFLVMELLEGESLDALAERRGGKLPAAEVLPFAERLLDVLVAAHQKGIVHRDIKPDNVFLTREGVIKLLDFGIARMRDGGAVALTAEGASFGTPAFMAPEQALGRTDEIDGRTDLFSVGATMFFLLTGRCVHVTRTLNEQIVAQATTQPPPLASVAPQIPAVVSAIVDRALAFAKPQRWPNARAMREAIHAVHDLLGAPGAAGVAGALPPPPATYAVTGAGPAPQAAAVAGTMPPSVTAAGRPTRGRSTVYLGFVAGVVCVAGAAVLLRFVAGPSSPGVAAPAATSSAEAAGATSAQTAARSAGRPEPAIAVPTATAAAAASPVASAPPSASATASAAVEPVASALTPPAKRAVSDKAPKKAPATKKGADESWLDRQH